MRQIGIKKLRANFATELKDLPFEIVSNKKPIAVVMKPGHLSFSGETLEIPGPVDPIPVATTLKDDYAPPISAPKQTPRRVCPHGVMLGVGICKKGCKP